MTIKSISEFLDAILPDIAILSKGWHHENHQRISKK